MPIEKKITFCRVCEPACGLVASVDAGELVALAPDPAHPVTQGFACNKGIAGLDIHRDPDRLARPLKRGDDGSFAPIAWTEATREVAQRLRAIIDESGPDAVAAYIGNPTAFNTLAGPALGSFFGQLGTRRSFGSGTQDCTNKFAASEAVYGTATLHPVPDIANANYLLIIGENPRVSHMSFLGIADPVAELKAAVKRGATVRYVNPRRIEKPEAGTGEVTWIKPDTDTYFLAALLCEIFAAGLADEATLRAHGSNVEGLRAFVAQYPAERAARITGIAASELRAIARAFATAPAAAVHASTGLNMGRQGTLAYWLVQMLALVTGNLDRRGGNLYSFGFYPAARAGRIDPKREVFFDSKYGKMRRIRGSLPGNLLADEILSGEPRVRALVVVAGNPLLSVGGGEHLRKAFEQLDLLVVIDLYRNATGELAHYLLPSTDMFERADVNITGLGMQYRPYVQYTDAVVAPRDERKPEWWILARIEQELGLKSVLDAGPEPELFGRIGHMLKSRGHSLEELRANPHGIQFGELETGAFYDEWVQTADKRVDCCPALFAEALARAETICRELEAERADQLKLITRRDPWMHNSWYHNVERMKRPGRLENPLHMNPDDALRLGLRDGARVTCRSAHGAVDATLAYDADLMPGVVSMTHGWGHAKTGMRVAQKHPGVNANALLPSGPGSFEPLSNQAHMTGIPVEVSAASA
jgi:anaerobic selenocysteine-containing dehydrogenase